MNDWHDAEQRVEKAQELFAQRKWSEALSELRAAIALNPNNASWHFNLGLTLDELDRYDEAIASYQRGLKLDPQDVEALYRVGVDLSQLGRFADSICCFEQIESIDASFEPSYCGRIIAYTELHNHEKAEEMFYLARQYKEECSHCYYNIAASLSRRRLFDKAIYCWQKVLDLDDTHPQVHALIAGALWEKGELEKARQHYMQELRSVPGDTSALMDLGNLLMEMGRAHEAGEKFRRAIELSTQEPAVHLNYARWLLVSDQVDACRDALDQVLRLDRHYPGAHLCLAELAMRSGNIQTARVHLRVELRQCPQDTRLLMDLGNLLIDCGQHRAAAACLKRLTTLDPRNAVAWQNLGVAQFLCRQVDLGITSCLQSLMCNSRQSAAMYNLALAYQRLGDYPRAGLWIQRALEVDPGDVAVQRLEMRLRLGKTWRRVVHAIGGLFWKKATRHESA